VTVSARKSSASAFSAWEPANWPAIISVRNIAPLMPITVQRIRLYLGFMPSKTGTPPEQQDAD
jgi:hypothetical protein